MNMFNNIKRLLTFKASRTAIAIATSVVTLVMLMSIMIIKRNDVAVYVDGEQVFAMQTLSDDSELWLEKAGVTVNDGDSVKVKENNVYIKRAIYITVTADGEQVTFKAYKGTVKSVLKTGGFEYSNSDIITPALDEKIEGDAQIVIERVKVATVTETETVKFSTEKIKTNDLYEGQSEVVTEGVNGKTEHTYEVTYIDGKETNRVLLKTEVKSEPVTKVIRVGTKIKSSFLKTASTPTVYKQVIAMKATAYTYGNDGGNTTCLGQPTRRGIVAVDPKVIPLGTKLYIESADGKYIYGEAVAGDTGGAIKGNKIDLFVESASECKAFGRRTVNVYILE